MYIHANITSELYLGVEDCLKAITVQIVTGRCVLIKNRQLLNLKN